MNLKDTKTLLSENNKKSYRKIYLWLLLFVFSGIIYLFYYDNISSPKKQLSFINDTISSAVKNGFREKINSYIIGITSYSDYKLAWISDIDDKSKYGKYNENLNVLLDFKRFNFSIALLDGHFYVLVNEYLSDKYLPFELNYQFHLLNRVHFEKYILIFIIVNIILLFVIRNSYLLNNSSAEFVSNLYTEFIEDANEINKNHLFKSEYKHKCIDTYKLSKIINSFCNKMSELNKKFFDLEARARFAEHTDMLAHDANKIVGLLLRMRKNIVSENDVERCKRKIDLFSDEIQLASNKVSTILNEMTYLSNTKPIKKDKVYFYDEFYLPIINKFEEKNCHFIFDSDQLTKVFIDKVSFERVLNNIIANAIEAIDSEVDFNITTKINKLNDFDEIIIRNDKSFVNSDELNEIFEIYFTKDKKNGSHGNGLGLVSVKQAVEDHGGQVHCFSSAKEKFVEFRITIPSK